MRNISHLLMNNSVNAYRKTLQFFVIWEIDQKGRIGCIDLPNIYGAHNFRVEPATTICFSTLRNIAKASIISIWGRAIRGAIKEIKSPDNTQDHPSH